MSALSRKAELLSAEPVELGVPERAGRPCDACALPRSGLALLGGAEGAIGALKPDGAAAGPPQSAHAGAARVCAARQARAQALACTVGPEDETQEDASQSVKVWSVANQGSSISLQRSARLFSREAPRSQRHGSLHGASKATAIDALVDHGGSQVSAAIGLLDGSVAIARVELARERVGRHRISPPSHSSSPVTHVAWRSEGSHSLLFVVTEECVACYDVDAACSRLLYDTPGAKRHCAALLSKQQLVVAHSEAVYFYDAEERGSALALGGEKRALSAFAGHLVAITEPAGRAAQPQLQVYDLQHKVIAFEGDAGDLDLIACDADSQWALVLQSDQAASSGGPSQATLLTQKSTSAKIDVLCGHELFEVALKVARNEEAPETKVAEVQRRYGDSLYSKHDYDGAMAQYLETVGHLEPSHVVRLFLDANRIRNLTSYLERLHSHSTANSDHTTLLLSCYIKLQDVAKLDAFLLGDLPGNVPSGSGAGDESEHDEIMRYRQRFDVETVIQVCRSAGYFEHANRVACRSSERELQLSILMEDLQRFDEAIELLRSYPQNEIERAVRRFGRRLLQERPSRTADVLKDICDPQREDGIRRAASILGVFSEHPYSIASLLEGIIPKIPRYVNLSEDPSPAERTLYNTYIEVLLRESLDSPTHSVKALSSSDNQSQSPYYHQRNEKSADEAPSNHCTLTSRSSRRQRALEVLKQGWQQGGHARYDKDHLLVLCQRRDFRDGSILLFERMRRYDDVLRCYMDAQDYRGLLDAASRFGTREPQLWFEVLSYLAGQSADVGEEVEEALSHIEEGQLLAPLLVLQTLSRNSQLPLRVVKGYVKRALAKETDAIERESAAVEHNRKETERMQAELTSLQSEPQVFQNNRCALCQAPLDLPAVHFLCMHSFHQRCLGVGEPECPQCAGEHREVSAIKSSIEASHAKQEQFFQSLERDTFGAVANSFQRGAMHS